MKNVVEYEKKSGKKDSKDDNKGHLKSKEFLDAKKLLSNDKDD